MNLYEDAGLSLVLTEWW